MTEYGERGTGWWSNSKKVTLLVKLGNLNAGRCKNKKTT